MKIKFFYLFLMIITVSCSSSDDSGNGENETIQISFVDKIVNISQNGSTELRFIYNAENNLIKTETDTYERDFTYSGDRITKIVSTTLPSTPYYTIDFVYEGSKVVEVQRNNHYNNSVFYVTYEYDNSNRVSKVCTYDNVSDYNTVTCNRFYEMSYVGNTNNYAQKDLVLNTINGSEFLETSTWAYDFGARPYFGEAVEKIRLPYATDGTGMDYEFIYNTNNPLTKHVFDTNTNENKLRKNFVYEFNGENVLKMTIQSFDINSGMQISTFTQNFTYVLK